jgi:hypothetical protein
MGRGGWRGEHSSGSYKFYSSITLRRALTFPFSISCRYVRYFTESKGIKSLPVEVNETQDIYLRLLEDINTAIHSEIDFTSKQSLAETQGHRFERPKMLNDILEALIENKIFETSIKILTSALDYCLSILYDLCVILNKKNKGKLTNPKN